MVKKYYLIIVVIAVTAITGSLLLLPGSHELALMLLKDKHFDEARQAYEENLAQGVPTLETANQLMELYLQSGDINKAIDVVKRYVDAHPRDLEMRKRLGTLYQYAQRQDDYLHNLEEMNKISPQPETLKILSDIYNLKGEYDKQADILANA